MSAGTVGKVVQVLGAVVDCEFPAEQMPAIFNAVEIQRDPAALNTLGNTIATRELWGGEPFWGEYRRRFDLRVSYGYGAWVRYISDPNHQTIISVLPAK